MGSDVVDNEGVERISRDRDCLRWASWILYLIVLEHILQHSNGVWDLSIEQFTVMLHRKR